MNEKTVIQVGTPARKNIFRVYIQNNATRTMKSLQIDDYDGQLTDVAIKEVIIKALNKTLTPLKKWYVEEPEEQFNRQKSYGLSPLHSTASTKRQHKHWEQSEDDYLLAMIKKHGRNQSNYENIARKLKREPRSVGIRISVLTLRGGGLI